MCRAVAVAILGAAKGHHPQLPRRARSAAACRTAPSSSPSASAPACDRVQIRHRVRAAGLLRHAALPGRRTAAASRTWPGCATSSICAIEHRPSRTHAARRDDRARHPLRPAGALRAGRDGRLRRGAPLRRRRRRWKSGWPTPAPSSRPPPGSSSSCPSGSASTRWLPAYRYGDQPFGLIVDCDDQRPDRGRGARHHPGQRRRRRMKREDMRRRTAARPGFRRRRRRWASSMTGPPRSSPRPAITARSSPAPSASRTVSSAASTRSGPMAG